MDQGIIQFMKISYRKLHLMVLSRVDSSNAGQGLIKWKVPKVLEDFRVRKRVEKWQFAEKFQQISR